MAEDWIKIEQLTAVGVVGLHEWERQRKQEILIDASVRMDFTKVAKTDCVEFGVNYADLAAELLLHAETAERYTIEALATDLAGICLDARGVEAVVVEVAKPRADARARQIAVRVSRAAGELVRPACIGLGSNHDAEANLARAVAGLASIGAVSAVSNVYESTTIDGADQPDFLNAAVLIETALPAGVIRRRLKAIEASMGRSPESASGVIPVDLDLCLLGDQIVRTGGVCVPDPNILERAYLAITLSELHDDLRHPETSESLKEIAARLSGAESVQRRSDVVLVPGERGGSQGA